MLSFSTMEQLTTLQEERRKVMSQLKTAETKLEGKYLLIKLKVLIFAD